VCQVFKLATAPSLPLTIDISVFTHLENQVQRFLNRLAAIPTVFPTYLAMEQCILDTNAGKQLSYAATDV
jgi:hypothetical protein